MKKKQRSACGITHTRQTSLHTEYVMNAPNIDSVSANGAKPNSPTNSEGNTKLTEAFEYAIKGATQTLTITTKKGADLYALKQRPQ